MSYAQKAVTQRANSTTRRQRLEKLRKMRARSQQRRAEAKVASPAALEFSPDREANDSVQHIEINSLSIQSERSASAVKPEIVE